MQLEHLDPRNFFHAVLSQGRGLQKQCRVPIFGRYDSAFSMMHRGQINTPSVGCYADGDILFVHQGQGRS